MKDKNTYLTISYNNDEYRVVCPPGTVREARAIYRRADEGGTIQVEDMLYLFPGAPTLHRATSLYYAFIAAGYQVVPA